MSKPTIHLNSSEFSPPPAGQPGCRSNAPTNAGTQAPAPIFGSARWSVQGGGFVTVSDPFSAIDAVIASVPAPDGGDDSNTAFAERLRKAFGDTVRFENADGTERDPNTTELVTLGKALIDWSESLGKDSAPTPTSGPTAA